LRQWLIALQFKREKELIKASQSLEAWIGEGHQGQYGIGKRKDIDFFMNRPPLLKKGKNGLFDQFKKKIRALVGSHQDTGAGMMGGQTRPRNNLSGGSSY